MPKPRAQLVSVEATTYYHCISRCVRRAFLCGEDHATGKNFDHRKQWLVDKFKELAGVFAVDICAYAVMSNHFHLVLHIDREKARAWSDEEVKERYASLFPQRVEDCKMLPAEAKATRVATWRERLWSLSWFMRCLNESIARRANREDECSGRFWEGRFYSQALLDEGALLTCMSYVDLNPIRAGMACTVEESEFTSVRERLATSSAAADLVPFSDECDERFTERLPATRQDYIDLLRWAAGEVTSSSAGTVPASTHATLDRLGIQSANFVEGVRQFSRSFFTMVGAVHLIDAESGRRGYKRRPGRTAAGKLYQPRAA